MKKLIPLLILIPAVAMAATFHLFKPAAGILKGDPTTYVTTTAVGTDVSALWTGTCDSTTWLRADGVCATPPGTGTGVSLGDVPTWTGVHTWSLAEPRWLMNETDQGSNLKTWDFDLNGGVLTGRTRTDADGAGVNWLSVTRGATTAISALAFGNATNNPTFTFLGNGATAFSGQVSGPRFNLNATAGVPSTGIGAPAGNTLGFYTNSALVGSIDINGYAKFVGAIASGGTKFTASGCSNSTTVGGAVAGKFTSGTTGTCTVTITLPTATNGYTCYTDDLTTPLVFTQSASTTTSCTVSGTTVTGDIVTFMAMAY